ncbi:RNA-directed DNA polymerase, eukaryota [Tanacetum coccineum]
MHTTYVEGVVLGVTPDRWYWTLDGSGEFPVASARKVIDDNRFPEVSTQTRWIKAVPIKVNIHAWNVRMDCLPTRLNISRRGIDIPSILCPVCGSVTESSSHLFFNCRVAKDNFRKICRWWEVDFMEVHTFDEWVSWIVNLRIPIKHKRLLEGLKVIKMVVLEPVPSTTEPEPKPSNSTAGSSVFPITGDHPGGATNGGDGDVSEGYETASETEVVDDESVPNNNNDDKDLNDVIEDHQKPLEQVTIESKDQLVENTVNEALGLERDEIISSSGHVLETVDYYEVRRVWVLANHHTTNGYQFTMLNRHKD